MNRKGSIFTASVKRNLRFVCMCLYMGNRPCSTVANIASVPAICIELACMHAQAKIALPEQLEQYLNDLDAIEAHRRFGSRAFVNCFLPSCFGVQTVSLSLSNIAISPCTAPTLLRLARSGMICT